MEMWQINASHRICSYVCRKTTIVRIQERRRGVKAQAAATEKHLIASLNEAVCYEEQLGESLQTDGNKSDAKK